MQVDRSYTRLTSVLPREKNVKQNVELIQIKEMCLKKQCDENICVTRRYLKFLKFITKIVSWEYRVIRRLASIFASFYIESIDLINSTILYL